MRTDKDFNLFAEDFWNLINKQEYKCALSNRELTPSNTVVELRKPNIFDEGERSHIENYYLVDHGLSQLCRYLNEDEIIELAIDIVRYRGIEKGYSLIESPEKER